MKLFPRSIATLAAVGILIASCGGGASTGAPASAAAAAATPAAATATPAPVALPKTLILVGDTVRGTTGLTDDEKTFLGCTQQNRFTPDSQIVWRYRAIDPMTAKPLSDKQLKSFTLTLPDGKVQNFKYGEHPKGSNVWFWTTSFVLPKDYPTGAFTYKAVATDADGRTGQFEQFNVATAMLQVIPAGTR